MLCVVTELVLDDGAVDAVVELLTDEHVAVLRVVAELVLDNVVVDTVVELLTDADVVSNFCCRGRRYVRHQYSLQFH